MSVPSKEQLKARSKHLAQLLQEKYNVKVSHGHCLDVISQLFGFKDWNTASAASPSEEPTSGLSDRRQSLIEALKKDFDVTVELPSQI